MAFNPSAVLAVFFDLDDTLMDTAGQLVEAALADAAAAMVEAGLQADVDAVRQHLHGKTTRAAGSDYFASAAEEFGLEGSLREEVIDAGRHAFFHRPVPAIELLPGSRPLLAALQQRCRLYLVTAGSPATQRTKVERLRIGDTFDDICWIDSLRGEQKGSAFGKILEREGLDPSRCVCVGDRVMGEIADANRLGMWTIRVRRGEFAGVAPDNADETPDFTVDDLFGVAELLQVELDPDAEEAG